MNTDEAANRRALLRFIERHGFTNSTGFAAMASFLVGEGVDHVQNEVQVAIIQEEGEFSLLLEYPLSAYGETVPQHLKPTMHMMRLHRHGKLIAGHINGPESDFIVWLNPMSETTAVDHSISNSYWSWVDFAFLRSLLRYLFPSKKN